MPRQPREERNAAGKVSAPTADQVIFNGPVGSTCFLMSSLARLAAKMASSVASPLPLKRDEQGRIFTPPHWSARMHFSPRSLGVRNDEGLLDLGSPDESRPVELGNELGTHRPSVAWTSKINSPLCRPGCLDELEIQTEKAGSCSRLRDGGCVVGSAPEL